MSLDFLKKAESANEPLPVPNTFKKWFTPYEHQASAVQKLLDNDGKLILAHAMGTGKTVTSIYGIEVLRHKNKAKNALIVVPAGLRENFARKGLEKFLIKPDFQIVGTAAELGRPNYISLSEARGKPYTIVSYAMFRRDPVGLMQRTGADTLVFDEFHKTRNESSSTFQAAMAARKHARNFIGLTASMINNEPAEVASLTTISEGKRFGSPAEFRRHFTRVVGYEKGFGKTKKKVRVLQRHGELVRFIDPKVSYVSTDTLKGKSMPTKDVRFVDVPMSEDQYRLYQLALNKLGPVKTYITRRDPSVVVKKIDSKLIFAQTSHARQIANSVHMGRKMDLKVSARKTPKVKQLLDDAEKHLRETPDGKVVLYSNLIRGGVDVLSAGLTDRGLDHALFIGKGTEVGGSKVTSLSRAKGVEDFQQGKKKIIVLSGAGAEGLDLPNATGFFSLDGHFNPERVLQAEGRVRRLGGQAHRPPEQRKVIIRRYRNVAPKSKRPGFFGKLMGRKTPRTTDQWMYATAGRKRRQTEEFYTTIKGPKKYIRRWRNEKGEWEYEYPKKTSGLKLPKIPSLMRKNE